MDDNYRRLFPDKAHNGNEINVDALIEEIISKNINNGLDTKEKELKALIRAKEKTKGERKKDD